jgi:hypothetical protein
MVTDLIGKVSPLQAKVCTDMLVNGPCKLVIEFPCDKCKQNGTQTHDTGQCDKIGAYMFPKMWLNEIVDIQRRYGVADLVKLNSGVDEKSDVVEHETYDLNRVLEAECIPNKNQLVDEAEHENGKIGRNCCCFGVAFAVILEAGLEPREDVSKSSNMSAQ